MGRIVAWLLGPGAWPGSPEEQLMFAGARLRVIRTAIWVGWVSLAAMFGLTVFHTRHIERVHHTHIWILLALAVAGHGAMYLVPWRRLANRRLGEVMLYAWVGSVIAFVGVLRYMAGPFSSDFYLVYLPVILFAAAAFRVLPYTAIVGLVVASYLAIALFVGLSPRDLILRVAAILLTAALAGYLAGEQRVKARSIALLHEALLSISAERDPNVLRAATLSWARRLTGADAAALVPAPETDAEPAFDPPGSAFDASSLPLVEARSSRGSLLFEEGPGRRTALLVPLGSDGVLVARSDRGALSATEQYLLETLAAEASLTLETLRLNEGLREKEHARGQLLRRVIFAQEDERRRIARELHDGTSQDLAGLVVGLEALERAPGTVTTLELKRLARRVADEIRRTVMDLRPRVLDDLGLAAAIRWLANERHADMDVAVDVPAEVKIPPPLDIAVYRVIQEALTNVERHANASKVAVGLRVDDQKVRVVVEDDGRGFDPADLGGGLGLAGMRERAEQHGGTLTVESRPGGGTRLALELPLEG